MLPAFLSAVSGIPPHRADRIFIDPPACIAPTIYALESKIHAKDSRKYLQEDAGMRLMGDARVHYLATRYHAYPQRVRDICLGNDQARQSDLETCIDYWRIDPPTWHAFRGACIAVYRNSNTRDVRTNEQLERELDAYPYNDVVRRVGGAYVPGLPLISVGIPWVILPHRTILQDPRFGFDSMDATSVHTLYDRYSKSHTLDPDTSENQWLTRNVPRMMNEIVLLAKCDRDRERLHATHFTDTFTREHIRTSRVRFWGDDLEPIGADAIIRALRVAIAIPVASIIPDVVDIDVTTFHGSEHQIRPGRRKEVHRVITRIFDHNAVRAANEIYAVARDVKVVNYTSDPTEDFDRIVTRYIQSLEGDVAEYTAWFIRNMDPILREPFNDPTLPRLTVHMTDVMRKRISDEIMTAVFPESDLQTIVNDVVEDGKSVYADAHAVLKRRRGEANVYADRRVRAILDILGDDPPGRFTSVVDFLQMCMDKFHMPRRHPTVMALYALHLITSQPKCPPSATSTAR